MRILVPIKWSALRVEVEPLSGAATTLEGRYGIDPASEAALEWALRLAEAAGGRVMAVTVGPPAADEGLRRALAAGVAEVIRVEAPAGSAPLTVGAALTDLAAEADLVVAGAWSEDGGSGAVPPIVAARLGRPQACGLLDLRWDDGALVGQRRLPAGRREILRITLPAVVSVEPGTVALRRAPLPSMLTAASASIPLVRPQRPIREAKPLAVEPYRPRPRSLPPIPEGDDHRVRIAALSGMAETARRARRLRLDPPEAAAAIVEALRSWGYLEG
jgi:electron transfer flavoprotein beta subunit